MSKILTVTFVTIMAIAAYLYVALGLDWLNPDIGRGLNPWISFPAAGLCVILAIVVPWYFHNLYRDVLEEPLTDEDAAKAHFLKHY